MIGLLFEMDPTAGRPSVNSLVVLSSADSLVSNHSSFELFQSSSNRIDKSYGDGNRGGCYSNTNQISILILKLRKERGRRFLSKGFHYSYN